MTIRLSRAEHAARHPYEAMNHNAKRRLHWLCALVLLLPIGGLCADERMTPKAERSTTKTRSFFYPREAPSIEDPETGRLIEIDGSRLSYRGRPTAYSGHCVVDFTDAGALQLSEPTLWFDRIYLPWYQACGDWGHVDLRPLEYGHFHLGFEDPDVVPCNSHPQAYPSRILADESCDLVDVPTEARTHLTTHWSDEWVLIRAHDAWNGKFIPFDLNQIRVVGSSPIRFCYKKNQETDLDWLIYETDAYSSPGVWLCWNQLDTGTWNLSNWAWDVTEVKITGKEATFSIDDIAIGIP